MSCGRIVMVLGVSLALLTGCASDDKTASDAAGRSGSPAVEIPARVQVPAPPHEKIDLPPLTYAPGGAWANNAHIALSPTAIVFEVNGKPVDIGIETIHRDPSGKFWREPAPGRTAQRRNAHPYEFLSLPAGAHTLKVRHRTGPLKLEDEDFRPEVPTKDIEFEIDVLPGRNYYMTHSYYRFDADGKLITSNWLYLAEIVEGVGPDGTQQRMFLIVDSDQGGSGLSLEHQYRIANLWENSPDLTTGEARILKLLYWQDDWKRAEALRASAR